MDFGNKQITLLSTWQVRHLYTLNAV